LGETKAKETLKKKDPPTIVINNKDLVLKFKADADCYRHSNYLLTINLNDVKTNTDHILIDESTPILLQLDCEAPRQIYSDEFIKRLLC
jgi:hypothetical protein